MVVQKGRCKLHATLALTQSSGFEEALFQKGAFHLTIALGLCSWDTSWRTVGEPLGAVYMAIRSTLQKFSLRHMRAVANFLCTDVV